jgi:hypothetical protein
MNPGDGLLDSEKRKICFVNRESKDDPSIGQPVAYSLKNTAIPRLPGKQNARANSHINV